MIYDLRLFAERIPDFLAVDDLVRLFPELRLGKFAVEPAVADDAVLRRQFAGEIIRLRGASDGGKRWRDLCERAAFEKFRDARCVFADERFGEADDVDDGETVHLIGRCRVRPVAESGRATGSTLHFFTKCSRNS